MKKINFVTSNQEKVKEAKKILEQYKIIQKDIDYPEIQSEIKEVAKHGSKWCFEKIREPLFIEDSGLFIDKFEGFPGPYSSYIYKKLGNEGILKLMKNIENRRAYFYSIIAYKTEEKSKLFEGKVKGKITKKVRGKKGFGYDPIFQPKKTKESFGEMKRDKKNQYSHRKKALKKFSSFLTKNI